MVIDTALIRKYNRPGPRYTSYPPATFFNTLTTEQCQSLIVDSNGRNDAMSLYIHIPFCAKICHFCGCHTSPMQKRDYIARYIKALKSEITQTAQLLDRTRPVTQIHWGGGTPNSIDTAYIREVMTHIYDLFEIADEAEVAMECNPAHLELHHIKEFADMGFNRLSLGMQDVDEAVLETINRDPSRYPIEQLIEEMRKYHFTGINLDLVYGLPGQTAESFTHAVQQAIDTNPDRIVTFSYAHVPWVKKAQSILEEIGLPDSETKLAMFESAYELLTQQGYRSIGLDHFVKEDDELWIALQNRTLHRNFQGYCSRKTTGQVYGFGCSSISQLESAYIQNEKETGIYMERIENEGFAFTRGCTISTDEQVIRSAINAIMCDGYLNFEELARMHNTSVVKLKELLNFHDDSLSEFIDDELLTYQNNCVEVTERGTMVVRNIAMVFDPLVTKSENMYSKTI